MVKEVIDDLVVIEKVGLCGIMMFGVFGEMDYDKFEWDLFWVIVVEVGLLISFYIFIVFSGIFCGGKFNGFMIIVWGI